MCVFVRLLSGMVVGLILPALLFLDQAAALDTPEATRDAYRYQIQSLSSWATEKIGQVKGPHLVLAADFGTGRQGSADGQSVQDAVNSALAACRQGGGECERLYTLTVGNSTDVSITVNLYMPRETETRSANSLFTWTVKPDEKIRLSINHAGPVFVNRKFILHMAGADGFARWGPKTIDAFKSEESNDNQGDNLTILASESRVLGEQHLSLSYGVPSDLPDDKTKLFQVLAKNAEKGVSAAQFWLAVLYEEGKGCRQDLAMALRWYDRAAGQGHSEARQTVKVLRSKLTCPWILNEVKQMKQSQPAPATLDQQLVELLGDPVARCVASGRWAWEWQCLSEGSLPTCFRYTPDRGRPPDNGASDQEEPSFTCRCTRDKEPASPTK